MAYVAANVAFVINGLDQRDWIPTWSDRDGARDPGFGLAARKGGGEVEEMGPRETAKTAAGETVLVRARTTASTAGAKPRDTLWAIRMEGDEYIIVKASAPVRRFPDLEQELLRIVTSPHR